MQCCETTMSAPKDLRLRKASRVIKLSYIPFRSDKLAMNTLSTQLNSTKSN